MLIQELRTAKGMLLYGPRLRARLLREIEELIEAAYQEGFREQAISGGTEEEAWERSDAYASLVNSPTA